MISTVTISTVTTVTTVMGFGVTLGLVALIALAVSLCAKELAAARAGSTSKFLTRSLDVSILPLAVAFVMIVSMKLIEILA